ncbi:uncharacterized protein [Coffea arabica]|uniref:GRF-type domain-containing protein n=1 Tax=Coffea arabica TaxID=13443 RepID=A0ABM4V087_COFAR
MGKAPNCSYSIPATVKTSWTAKNPGKKFYGCAYYEHNNGGGSCGYFKWHETSGCERCDKLVRHTRNLIKKVKDLEIDVEKTKQKERRINLMLFMAIVTVIYQWLWKE